MENVTKTRLQAFKEAKQTGQIAITQHTAEILEHMMTLEDVVDTLCDDFTQDYIRDAQDAIYDRIYTAFGPFYEEIWNELKNRISTSLCSVEFEGL